MPGLWGITTLHNLLKQKTQMKKTYIITLACALFSLQAHSQALIVSGGPGKINEGSVFANTDFTVSVQGTWTGNQGAITPARWTLANGLVNGNVVDDHLSNTSRSMQVGNTGIQSNLTVVSAQGSTQYYGLSRWIRICDASIYVQETSVCNPGTNTREIAVELLGSGNPTAIVRAYDGLDIEDEGTGSGIVRLEVEGGTFNNPKEYLITVEYIANSPEVCIGGTQSTRIVVNGCGIPAPRGSSSADSQIPVYLDANMVSLYPNPSAGQDVITVQIPTGFSGFNMEVVNQQGQVVKVAPIVGNKNDLNIGGLDRGVYYIRFKSENFVGTRKLIID
ncbi:MAG TPA: hypothetical protein DCE41_05695 [Cytophagales bacterium]|nr:hypothetical protein [Cytophagales bacterium]HAA23984.1 hypothetical protein [Cytophagales bacterium]